MPKFRDITVSIISQWEMKQFPEFPHPDSVRCESQCSTQRADSSEPRPASTSTFSTSTSKACGRLDKDPTISCYIPSVPGIRFFLKYTIEPPHPEGQLFYFKLLMNGRHISSWGVNPRTNPRGQVLRGLFEPDGKWSVSENSRTVLTHSGIESRPFLFTPEVSGKSAADDGGLIEVRIFRAKGRKRRAPSLETFRPQEHYGINLPSAGLLDKPQDTRYYDYILVDPKDEPYVAFLFHYRSWEFLQSLQLIPSSHPRALLKPSNSFAFLAGPSTEHRLQDEDEEERLDSNYDDNFRVAKEDSPPRMAHISQLGNENVSESGHDRQRYIGGRVDAFKSSFLSLEQRNIQAGIPISAFSVPEATLNDWAYERPLPRLPRAKSSFDHSRNSSTSSIAPSIASSLIPWLDRDSDNPSPEPIIGVAVKIPVPSSLPQLSDSDGDRFSYSTGDWSLETPPQRIRPLRPMSNPLVIPPEAHFPPPSVTIRKSRRENSHLNPAQGHLVVRESSIEDDNPEDHHGGILPPPLEAEMFSSQQGLSPAQKKSKHIEITPPWNLNSANSVDKSDLFVLVRGKHMARVVNGTGDRQVGESDSENQHVGNSSMPEATAPCQCSGSKSGWI